MGHGAMAFVRWGVALTALAVAAFVAVGALTGPGGDRPAPIEVAGSAVPGGDGTLREVEPARVLAAAAGPASTDAGSDAASASAPGDAGAAATTTLPGPPGSTPSSPAPVPGLGTVTDPATDPLADLLAPLPLVGTTTTTVAPAPSTTTTLLPGLPPLPLPPLPTLPLLPPLGG